VIVVLEELLGVHQFDERSSELVVSDLMGVHVELRDDRLVLVAFRFARTERSGDERR
jgi:hypothetical protein